MKMIDSVLPFLLAVQLLPVLINCYFMFYAQCGHPVMIIQSIITIFQITAIKIFAVLRRPALAVACVYSIVYSTCLTTSLVYMDWLPHALLGPKLHFQNEVIIYYCVCMV